ncbi:uncharacterized protein LOC142181922 [Nicotiana tabacum]|uniref:Uncharacterized protein LOC142181922 n=1 Tax=Nicotiana tabacum TaxID=4097 RepID=A0AC58UQD7_TOBAC
MHVTATFDNNRRRRLQLKWVRKELKACVCDDPFTPGHKCKAKRTLRIQGFTEQKPIHVLIDCGSTQNFINKEAIQRIGCKINQISPQDISVAGGRITQSLEWSKNFTWMMHGVVFQDDFLVLPVGSCDVVLGIQWLCKFGDIQTVDTKALNKISVKEYVQEDPWRVINYSSKKKKNKEIQQLLGEFRVLFKEPRQLPPSRGVFEHHIPLLESSTPVNSILYRYSPIQKDVIEEMVQEMQNQAERIEYLRHYISAEEVATDLKKKDNFSWSSKATRAFEELKKALTSALVLMLPDFSLPFIVERDACNLGIGPVLMQNGQPIAYLSKGLSPQHQALSVYDKELMDLIMAVNKWAQYLTRRPFTVKTDQKALKFLLEQKLHTSSQLKWITKLMQYDFAIEYKKGKDNKVEDALSRLLVAEFVDPNQAEFGIDEELLKLIQGLKENGEAKMQGYSFLHEQLRRNGKLVVGPDEQLRKDIMQL